MPLSRRTLLRAAAALTFGSQAFARKAALRIGVTDWKFNAWAKYPDWQLDDKLPAKMAKSEGVPIWQPVAEKNGKNLRVVLEGGSIDTNGQGALLTTEECLLSDVQARNPGLSRGQMEQVFAAYLGISHEFLSKIRKKICCGQKSYQRAF